MSTPDPSGDSPGDPSPPEPFGWTRPQRLTLGMLTALLLLFLSIQFIHRPATFSDSPTSAPFRLAAAIDPNTATADDLARIPHLGPKLAAALIAYRDSHPSPDAPLFRGPEDLAHIPAFNKSTAALVAPYLTFPDSTATAPATDPQ